MTKISGSTIYFKRVFPTMWFGFLAFFFVAGVISGATGLMFFVVPIIMGIVGFALFKKLVWDLADEVFDCTDHLLFKKGKLEQRIALSEVINIDHMAMSAPERITLSVRNEGPLGKELTFCASMRFNPFAKSKIVDELIRRVDEARR